jgi:hypothetical protein
MLLFLVLLSSMRPLPLVLPMPAASPHYFDHGGACVLGHERIAFIVPHAALNKLPWRNQRSLDQKTGLFHQTHGIAAVLQNLE